MKKTFLSHAFFVLTLLMVPHCAMADRYFYRAGPYYSEPRYDRNCLSTFGVSLMGGSTSNGFNNSGNKTNVLNIYGLENMRVLGAGMNNLDNTNFYDAILINLLQQGTNEEFGELEYSGTFKNFSTHLYWAQNYCHGFFTELIIPIETAKVTSVSYADQSPTTGIPNDQTGAWTTFLDNMDEIFDRYGFQAGDVSETTLGDIGVNIGWTYNNDSIDVIDFLDLTLRTGLVVPAARQIDPTQAFYVPLGYNGHIGFPLSFDMAVGFCNWVTAGVHVGGKFFLNADGAFRMKTDVRQNGYIKLLVGAAREDLGNMWDIGAFLKADHIFGGFSLMVSYDFAAQGQKTLAPYDTLTFDSSVVNTDSMLNKWNMHTINVAAEYDFAQEDSCWNPRVAVFYNVPVAGKNIYNTWMVGGVGGVNVTWKF